MIVLPFTKWVKFFGIISYGLFFFLTVVILGIFGKCFGISGIIGSGFGVFVNVR